ncbi:nitronate monooxygenase [Niallia endozanthoxylica]|uniref:nitronate monooxygenase n=1 Tax=Niallia endozanthoxylica TaxID=2036016 RepID=UPI0021DF9A74|nr:nitronate monooxygenase [Niallia endozanthoxylica]
MTYKVLSTAVSEAGGLGMIGCGTMNPGGAEQNILETKEMTRQPYSHEWHNARIYIRHDEAQ